MTVLREVLRRKGHGTTTRHYGYGTPKRRRGLKGRVVDAVLRRVERQLRKRGLDFTRR